MKLRILIVDDTDSMRLLVTQYLRRNDAVTIVGEADNADDAVVKAEESLPDIILMDVSLGGDSGVEVTRKIKNLLPKVRVYLFSAYEVDEYRELNIDSPAEGFIQKSNLKTELQKMIQKELEWKDRHSRKK